MHARPVKLATLRAAVKIAAVCLTAGMSWTLLLCKFVSEPGNQKEKAPDSRMSVSTADLGCLADDSWYDCPCSSKAKVKSIASNHKRLRHACWATSLPTKVELSRQLQVSGLCRADLYSSEKDSAEDA